MKTIVFLIFLLVFASSEVFAKLKVTGLNYNAKNSTTGRMVINFSGNLREAPELKVKKNILQVTLPETIVWPQIDKKITLKNKFDTDLKAYQFDKETVRVRAVLPYDISKKAENVSLRIKDNSIELYFPKKAIGKTVAKSKKVKRKTVKAAIATKKSIQVKKQEYDEKYLDYLLSQKENNKQVEVKKEILAKRESAQKETNVTIKDEVTTKAAAPFLGETLEGSDDKVNKKQFSVMSYIAKYIAFLGIILLGLYGAVRLMKKGVLKKGKLGFLNNTDIITVLSTTYIAPKKSLMLVKVHERILLLGNSDSGLTFLTEVEDTTSLLKEGEKKVSGANFDSTIDKVDIADIGSKVKEKQNPFAGYEEIFAKGSAKKNPMDSSSAESSKGRFSSQIKEKIKNLKPLNQ